jgi:ATP-dependent helicase/nuclease subunit A
MKEPLVIPDITRERQRTASDPRLSAWVSANAGSGKTHVLTERVIRLMLAGSPPSKLLCLTYTKAAAATMANRVFQRLAEWATLPEEKLAQSIEAMQGMKPTQGDILRARRLFAEAIETPGGLKIQTIHAFCEAVLHRFPLEAELPGGFELLDDQGAAELALNARDAVLIEAGRAPASGLGEALALAMARLGEGGIGGAVDLMLAGRDWLQRILAHHGTFEAMMTALARRLDLTGDETEESLSAEIVASPFRQRVPFMALIDRMLASSSNDVKEAERFIAATEGDIAARSAAWCEAFFTGSGTPRAKAAATKAIHEAFPALQEAFDEEVQRLTRLMDRQKALAAVRLTEAVLRLGDRAIAAYEAAKRRRGLLDFGDLITRTANLLAEREAALWVQYKLDQGIEHVLVDEAQDTSPEQWRIVGALTGDFFSGEGASRVRRTVFAVGDEKQSIYSFQGARPEIFAAEERRFTRAARDVGLELKSVPLQHSFRSTQDVLTAVDLVFSGETVQKGVAAGGWQDHLAIRRAAGEVELWPLVVASGGEEPDDWLIPLDRPTEESPVMRLAARVTAAVRDLIGQGIAPREILILVRKRGAFVEAVNRLMKEAGIPVAGADRLKLFRHIAVMDLLALGQIMVLPEDDLSLAIVLKSPLIGISEDELSDIAIGRGATETLGAALARVRPEIAARLDIWRELAGRTRAFEFYAAVLAEGGRRAIRARLGEEADEVLDEFLAAVIGHERVAGGGLTAFLHAGADPTREVKREMDEGRDEVRVMTVHGAKGLEAPHVILVDAAGNPAHAHHDPKLLKIADGPDESLALPLWKPASDAMPEAAANALAEARARSSEEHRRLLYVAMTRAADRLIVAGYAGKSGPHEKSWYEIIAAALKPEATEDKDASGETRRWLWRRSVRPPAPPEPKEVATAPQATRTDLPTWLTTPVAVETAPPVINPSRMKGVEPEEMPVRPGGLDAAVAPEHPALVRGRVIHGALERLPALAPALRRQGGLAYAARAHGLEADAAAGLIDEVLALFDHPDFAEVFGPGSRAEVPIIGRLKLYGRETPVSGRVDRLVVSPTRVTVLDFKTDLTVPDAVPEPYVLQLAIYGRLLREIFPDREVVAGIVWTALPRIDRLTSETCARALKKIGGG